MSLTKNHDSNPLICKVEISFAEDIQSMETVELHQVKITMKSQKAFTPVYVTPASYSFSEPSDVSAAGLLFKQRLNLYYPGIVLAMQPELINLERKPLVAKIYYQNGLVQVIGSLDNPAKSFNSFSSSDATGNSITIACDSDERARFEYIEPD